MSKKMKKCLILFFLIYPLGTLFSQEIKEIETDRPDQTECSSVIPVKSFQVETGISYEYDGYKSSSTKRQNYASTLFRFGIGKNIELRLVAGEYEKSTEHLLTETKNNEGFKPIELGTKVFICPQKGIVPQTSLLMHLELPLASAHYKGESVLPSFRFSMSHTLSKRMDAGCNIGMAWTPDSGPLYIYTLTVAEELIPKLSAYIETYGDFSTIFFPESAIDGGFTYALFPNWQLDISGGCGLNSFTPDYFIGIGLAFRLPH
jgi:hypothetical protein